MIMAYKGFEKDLSCTLGAGRYQYKVGEWHEEDRAKCANTGLHCAENPLDCLNYYPDTENSVYCIVLADGDVNEDGVDSRSSCTRMKVVKELKLKEFVMHSLNYIFRHPYRKNNRHVKGELGKAERGFVIVRGKHPAAKGKIGDILAFVKEEPDRRDVSELGIYEVDGKEILPDVWYDINGRRAAE